MSYYFKEGEGITSNPSNSENIFRDEHQRQDELTADDVREYLLGVVSGTFYPAGIESGEMHVSFEKLKELVKEEYNIVEVLNPEDLTPYNIHIVYQVYDKENKKNQGFRRKF